MNVLQAVNIAIYFNDEKLAEKDGKTRLINQSAQAKHID